MYIVQKCYFYLDQIQQCGLKLVFGQNSDLGWGGRAALLGSCQQPTTRLCLSEHAGREEQVGSHSGWYPLGRDDLDRQGQLWYCNSCPQWLKKKTSLVNKSKITANRIHSTWNCSAAFWPAVAVVGFGTEPAPWPWVGPRNRGASPGQSLGESWEARFCSCWTSWSFWRSSWGDTTPGIWEDRPEKNKTKKPMIRIVLAYTDI